MARITVEDCLEHENNRFALVQLASKRTKQILTGAPTVLKGEFDNKAVVLSLREIADGTVRFMTEEDMRKAEEAERSRREALREAVAQDGPSPVDSPIDGESNADESSDSEGEGGESGSHESASGPMDIEALSKSEQNGSSS